MLIPLAYYVASRLFSWRVGLYAAALVAVSPPLIQLSILVRPYAMLSVLCILTAYLFWECLREHRPRRGCCMSCRWSSCSTRTTGPCCSWARMC